MATNDPSVHSFWNSHLWIEIAVRDMPHLWSTLAARIQLPVCMCSWKDGVNLACRLCGLVLQSNLNKLFPMLMVRYTSSPPEGMKHLLIVCCD